MTPLMVAALIESAATGIHLTPDDLRQIMEHVAQAGFDPNAREKARGRLAGITWHGNVVKGSDLLSPAVAHYLPHVMARQEWPSGTTLQLYLESIRDTILSPRSGVLLCHYQDALQVTIVGRSDLQRGLNGSGWILVDYRVAIDHWTTAFQPEEGLAVLRNPSRRIVRWLRRPS